jgi:hypothetical protein
MEHLKKTKLALLVIAALCSLLLRPLAASVAQSDKGADAVQSSLDFEVYRLRIEPIFLKQRQDGVRCYNCHSVLTTRLRL